MPTPKIPSSLTILAAIALGTFLGSATGCGPKVDVKKDLAVVDVASGWFDAGIIHEPDGEKNKIVPSVTFRLKNTTKNVTVGNVQINAVFHQVSDATKEWGATWIRALSSEQPLRPGETSQQFVLRSDLGYKGPQPRLELLQNREFVDASVDINVKYGADQWVKVGTIQIARQLLTQ